MSRVGQQRHLNGGDNSPKLKFGVGQRFINLGDGLWRRHEREKGWESSERKGGETAGMRKT
jgi:hypothetical protein